MTADEYKAKLLECQQDEPEGAHVDADALLVAIITEHLGPEWLPVLDAYLDVPKWFA